MGNPARVYFVKSAIAGAAMGLMVWCGTVGLRAAWADQGAYADEGGPDVPCLLPDPGGDEGPPGSGDPTPTD